MIDVGYIKHKVESNPKIIKNVYALGVQALENDGSFNYRKFIIGCRERMKSLHIDEYYNLLRHGQLNTLSEERITHYSFSYNAFFLAVTGVVGVMGFSEFMDTLMQ